MPNYQLMWAHLPVRSLVDLQRQAAINHTGAQVRELYAQGYHTDGDQLLDELNTRIQAWRNECTGPQPEPSTPSPVNATGNSTLP